VFTDKELLAIKVSRFEYEYPFYCKIDSEENVIKLTLIKNDTLIGHIKREVKLNKCELSYNKIQNYKNQKANLKKTNISLRKNVNTSKQSKNISSSTTDSFLSFILVLISMIVSLLSPTLTAAILLIGFFLLIDNHSQVFNTIFWTIVLAFLGYFILLIIKDIIDGIKLKKKKKNCKIEMERSKKTNNLDEQKKIELLIQKEIQILKVKLKSK
jgi:hypothetical protein